MTDTAHKEIRSVVVDADTALGVARTSLEDILSRLSEQDGNQRSKLVKVLTPSGACCPVEAAVEVSEVQRLLPLSDRVYPKDSLMVMQLDRPGQKESVFIQFDLMNVRKDELTDWVGAKGWSCRVMPLCDLPASYLESLETRGGEGFQFALDWIRKHAVVSLSGGNFSVEIEKIKLIKLVREQFQYGFKFSKGLVESAFAEFVVEKISEKTDPT